MAGSLFGSLFGKDEEELPVENPVEQPMPVGIQNPMVKNYIADVYGDKFSDSARAKLKSQMDEEASGPNWAAGIAGLGAGLQGGDTIGAGMNILKNQQAQRDKKLADFDEGRKGLVDNKKLDMILRDDAKSQDMLAREADLGSQESKMAQDLAIEMGMKPELAAKLTAEQWKAQGPLYQKKYEIKQKAIDRSDARQARAGELGLKKEEKLLAANEKKKTAMNEIEQRRTDIKQNLGLVMDQIKDKGTYEMFGSHNQDMERRLDSVATDMAKLMDPTSVARPAEVDAIKRNLITAGFKNNNETALQILQNFEKEVDQRANNAYQIRGIEAPGQMIASGDAGAAARQKRIAELKAKKAGSYASK